MTPEVRKTEDGAYELGASIDGVFVPFISHPGSWVDGIVTAGKQADTETPGGETPDEGQHA